ncbi:MAG: SpoVR family protein [bacterium]|nr:SpoVR family protein [bacterium]
MTDMMNVLIGTENYTMRDLQGWDERIRELADGFGLDCFRQDFEICDHDHMIGFMAYSGMPSHYPHWSYGKAYEKQKTLYDHGVSGLPYEMVINSDPALAYLMKNNTLLLQVLTMAHVYGHNDFFKRNLTFRHSEPQQTIGRFKSAAGRIRGYKELHGELEVESFLDAAHSLSHNRNPYLDRKRLSREDQMARVRDRFYDAHKDQYPNLHAVARVDPEALKESLRKHPLEPDPDILLFIAEENPLLTDWQRDILYIVDQEARYFMPQIRTKIMNEGWASYWHNRILRALDLPPAMWLEFSQRHSGVLRPHPGGLNPYHVGYSLWEAIHVYYDGMIDESRLNPDTFEPQLFISLKKDFEECDLVPPDAGKATGDEKIFAVREEGDDRTFIERFLSRRMVQELGLFRYDEKDEGDHYDLIVTDTGNDDGWKNVRDELARSTGIGAQPVIRVVEAGFKGNVLVLEHEDDGYPLELEYAKETVKHLRTLWMRPVIVNTIIDGEPKQVAQYKVDEEVRVRDQSK